MDKPINKIQYTTDQIDRSIKSIRVDIKCIQADIKLIKEAITRQQKEEETKENISKGWFWS
jgi:precorrin isomerase